MRVKDKYDEAIECLTAHPDQIGEAWTSPLFHQAGSLFLFATPNGETGADGADWEECGCLTQIRRGACAYSRDGIDETLTHLIATDQRLPQSWDFVTVEHLPIFAEWQRRLDVLIRGVDPETLNHEPLPQSEPISDVDRISYVGEVTR